MRRYGARRRKGDPGIVTRMPAGAGDLEVAVARAGVGGKANSVMRRFASRDAVIVTAGGVAPAGGGGVWRRVIEAVGGGGPGAAQRARRRSTDKPAW